MHQLRIISPTSSARVGTEVLVSNLARLLASRTAECKADLVRETGLSRTTVDAGLRALSRMDAIRAEGSRPTPGRGRPAERIALNPAFGHVLIADCGSHGARLGIYDLGQRCIASGQMRLNLALGPEPVLKGILAEWDRLAAVAAAKVKPAVAVIGLPGPVDRSIGAVVRPPIMPGWDSFPVANYVGRTIGAPVVVENDVNLHALGEARALAPCDGPLLYVKVGTGIGGGIVGTDGLLLHGADGAAGDIGHVKVSGATRTCVCGKQGCLEAVASAAAVIRSLEDASSFELVTQEQYQELARLIASGDGRTVALVREASEWIGEVIANFVHILNPARIVLGGMLATSSDHVLATVRGIVYQRALPLATRNLTLTLPTLGVEAGLAGGLATGIERVLSPDLMLRRMKTARSLVGIA